MDMLSGAEVRWFRYASTEGGSHMARLNVRFFHEGREGTPYPFLLDTGAARSVAPREFAEGLLDLSQLPAQDSGMRDVHGRVVMGIPVELDLQLLVHYPDKPIRIREVIWFCSGRKAQYGLLGQRSLFEQVGALFLNFPHAAQGRRFGLFEPPRSLLEPHPSIVQ